MTRPVACATCGRAFGASGQESGHTESSAEKTQALTAGTAFASELFALPDQLRLDGPRAISLGTNDGADRRPFDKTRAQRLAGMVAILRRMLDGLSARHLPEKTSLLRELQGAWVDNGAGDSADAFYLRNVLSRLAGVDGIQAWDENRANTHEDALRLISKAIEACGEVAPCLPSPSQPRVARRGGWSFSSGAAP